MFDVDDEVWPQVSSARKTSQARYAMKSMLVYSVSVKQCNGIERTLSLFTRVRYIEVIPWVEKCKGTITWNGWWMLYEGRGNEKSVMATIHGNMQSTESRHHLSCLAVLTPQIMFINHGFSHWTLAYITSTSRYKRFSNTSGEWPPSLV